MRTNLQKQLWRRCMWVVANVCEEGFKEVGDGIEKERIHKVLERISEVLRVVR
jgi:hypothetical protein